MQTGNGGWQFRFRACSGLVLWSAAGVAAGCPARAQPAAPDLATDAIAVADEAPSQDSWVEWHTKGFFSSCDGNCAVSLYAGREVTTAMTSAFLIQNQVPPWRWQYGGAGLVAGSFSRRFATLFGGLDLELEDGVGQRFGDMHATEFWLAVDFRWTRFPWNDYLRTTVALADGPDYATRIDQEERRLSPTGTSEVLNFFSPEVTFALPSSPENQVFFRFHHRSGIFGLINGTHAGAQFATVGYRRGF